MRFRPIPDHIIICLSPSFSFPIHFRAHPIPDFSYLLHFVSYPLLTPLHFSNPSQIWSNLDSSDLCHIYSNPCLSISSLCRSVLYISSPFHDKTLPFQILSCLIYTLRFWSISWHIFSYHIHLILAPLPSMSCLLLSLPFLVGTNPIFSLYMLHNTFPVHMTSVRFSTVPFRF